MAPLRRRVARAAARQERWSARGGRIRALPRDAERGPASGPDLPGPGAPALRL